MSDAPEEPTNEAPEVTPQPEAPAAEPEQMKLEQAEAPAPAADPMADPVFRAQLEKRKAEEVARLRAEAEVNKATERAALEAKLRAEANAQQAADAEEAERQAKLTREQAMQEKIDALAKADAARALALEQAEAKVKATADRLDFVRAVTGSGKALASTDVGLEDLAMTKARELVATGKTLAEAVAALAEDKSTSYLFARDEAVAPSQASTAAGSSAPRAAPKPPANPAPQQLDAWKMSREEFAAFIARGEHLKLIQHAPRGSAIN